MAIHFIGAGPGAADLITVRGLTLIRQASVVLYAGSLVPEAILRECRTDACLTDTASLHLDEIITHLQTAHERGQDVARIHSGDPSLYGAIQEQIRRLNALGIPYDITPGVPAYAAAAASLGQELTLPDISQSIVLTRTAVRSSAMPVHEDLATFAKSGATLCIHLSVNNLARVVREVRPHYGGDCPVVVAYRVSWPDECFIRATVDTIREQVKAANITRTALILVGHVLGASDFDDSRLYDKAHHHILRPA